jgi:sigma-B regulation protein RsbU (phosphoserine phosphatase)
MRQVGQSDQLLHLLEEVDAALEKIQKGSYGLCEVCNESIEEDRLEVDPLLKNCLPHLTEAEQRLLSYDLDLASQVQSKLLPKRGFATNAWDTAYYYQPAGAVSGDYVDIMGADGSEGCFCFVVGDVTGKGVAASILMSNLHAIFRSLTTSSVSVGPLLEQANRLFCEGTTSRYFATIVVGQATSSGALEISNAGHPAPVLIQGNRVQTIPSEGVPIGMFCRGVYASTKLETAPGDTLVLYTDGLTEARNLSDEEYGEARLLSLLEKVNSLSPTDLVKALVADVKAFRSGAQVLDDTAILVLRRR